MDSGVDFESCGSILDVDPLIILTLAGSSIVVVAAIVFIKRQRETR